MNTGLAQRNNSAACMILPRRRGCEYKKPDLRGARVQLHGGGGDEHEIADVGLGPEEAKDLLFRPAPLSQRDRRFRLSYSASVSSAGRPRMYMWAIKAVPYRASAAGAVS